MNMKWISWLTLLCLAGSQTAYAGAERIGDAWYYREENGTVVKNAFVSLDGTSYYFGEDGRLQADRVISSGGHLFGLSENGALLRNQWRKLEKEEGKGRGWMYFGPDGTAFENGWISYNGNRYHFTGAQMDHGWFTDEKGAVYYLGGEDDGRLHTGWLIWKGDGVRETTVRTPGWYYFEESAGKMTADREAEIGGDVFAFNGNGTEVAGFCIIKDKAGTAEKYYDPVSGKRAEGWYYVDAASATEAHPEGWYYFTEGMPLRPGFRTAPLSASAGTAVVDGAVYAFGTGGKMITGTVCATNGMNYTFDTDGKMLTGTNMPK